MISEIEPVTRHVFCWSIGNRHYDCPVKLDRFLNSFKGFNRIDAVFKNLAHDQTVKGWFRL